jgi:divinyl protochlorophyllide a 8-vinyl-reductase
VNAVPATGAASVTGVARIGPNAITQVATALRAAYGDARTAELFAAAGLRAYLAAPPETMVDEREVVRLHGVLRTRLAPGEWRRVARAAGTATGDYLLAHRIPRFAQVVLKVLPASAASALLTKAIGRHAWTFAGSGTFEVRPGDRRAGRPLVVRIADCPLCREAHSDAPLCDYYSATFERLFGVLVASGATATETACCGRGDPACEFSIAW